MFILAQNTSYAVLKSLNSCTKPLKFIANHPTLNLGVCDVGKQVDNVLRDRFLKKQRPVILRVANRTAKAATLVMHPMRSDGF